MSAEEELEKAISLASLRFLGIKDKAGKPYIMHLIRVMNNLNTKDPQLMAIAMLHDIVEDKLSTFEELIKFGFSQRVIYTLILLTHDPVDTYDEYLSKLNEDVDSRLVKLADLKDNMDLTRFEFIDDKNLKRYKKYHDAYYYLGGNKL